MLNSVGDVGALCREIKNTPPLLGCFVRQSRCSFEQPMRNENATSVKRHREAGRFTTCDSDVPATALEWHVYSMITLFWAQSVKLEPWTLNFEQLDNIVGFFVPTLSCSHHVAAPGWHWLRVKNNWSELELLFCTLKVFCFYLGFFRLFFRVF